MTIEFLAHLLGYYLLIFSLTGGVVFAFAAWRFR